MHYFVLTYSSLSVTSDLFWHALIPDNDGVLSTFIVLALFVTEIVFLFETHSDILSVIASLCIVIEFISLPILKVLDAIDQSSGLTLNRLTSV